MPSPKNILGVLNRLESPFISVFQHRCVKVRNRNAVCTRCADACTSGAIHLGRDGIEVNPALCIGCGTCASACPTSALVTHHPSDAKLFDECRQALAASKEAKTICIACQNAAGPAAHLTDEHKVVRVTCLGRVEESLLVLLVCIGAQQVQLVHADCEKCSHHPGRATTEEVCNCVTTLLETWNCKTKIKLSDKFPRSVRLQENYDASKRAFFKDAKSGSSTAASLGASYAIDEVLDAPVVEQVNFVHVGTDKTLPHFIPSRRQRLLNALQTLGDPSDELITTRLWGHVIVDSSKCSSCQMCATFCPTGAIRKVTLPDSSFGIEHRPQICVKCRCCESICNENALHLSDCVFARDIAEDERELHIMKPRSYVAGDIPRIHERVSELVGIEAVYDH